MSVERYHLSPHSLSYIIQDSDGKENKLWLSSAIDINAFYCDEFDNNYGLLLKWQSAKTKKPHIWCMPSHILSGDGKDIFSKLLSEGVAINHSKKAKERLLNYIATANPGKKIICINHIGWHDRSFVLPDITFPKNENIVFNGTINHFATSGTLKDWQENIGKYAKNNSRLILALSCAFAAPLLKLTNEESGAIHLVGNSSLGKTTALQIAASIWGGGKDNFIKQWRMTSNALEFVAATHNDCLLPLDELAQADSKSVADIVYMLANNEGKKRLKSEIILRETPKWRMLILSTGEIDLATKIAENNRKIFAGLEVRFVSVPSSPEGGKGIFEDLHGFTSGEELSLHLKEASNKYYGTSIRRYLEEVTSNIEILPGKIKIIQQIFKDKYLPKSASGQMARVANRFGLIAAAGEIASSLDILPLAKYDSINALGKCFTDWLAGRRNNGDLEQEIAIAQVKNFFEKYGDSKFITIGDSMSKSITDRVGYKQKEGDSYHYFVLPEIYKSEICKGLNYRQVSKYLISAGFLVPDSEGKSQQIRHLPDIGKARIYYFKPDILL